MTTPAVHWQEGMFLQPHHFQVAARHGADQVRRNVKWDCYHNWGLRRLDYDRDALGAGQLVLRALEARLRDGTVLALPEDVSAPTLDFKEVYGPGRRVQIFLAVPQFRAGQANVPDDPADDRGRWRVETLELEDENTGLDPQPVPLRRLNVRLLTGDQDHAGYEVLPVLTVDRSPRGDGLPVVDATDIPPLLCCDAWPGLQHDILQATFQRLGRKIDLLADMVVNRGLTLDSRGDGAAMRVAQLDKLNEGWALLSNLAFVPGIHPLPAYLEMCRLVGSLSLFGRGRRAAEIPQYDHDDLGGCFWALKRQLDALLDEVEEPSWIEQAFRGVALRMQVALQPAWLEPAYEMFIGVRSSLNRDDCVRLLTRLDQLGMKLGSATRVDEIFSRGREGLRFQPCNTPATLPADNVTYFQVEESPKMEWEDVRRSLSLAIRVRSDSQQVLGSIDGQERLTIRHAGQTVTLEFKLFVVPRQALS